VRYAWYYQITTDDIERIHTAFGDFLKPTYEMLKQNADFQFLVNEQPPLLMEISELKSLLADRIGDPKHLADLIVR
jgi:hypothetical protein